MREEIFGNKPKDPKPSKRVLRNRRLYCQGCADSTIDESHWGEGQVMWQRVFDLGSACPIFALTATPTVRKTHMGRRFRLAYSKSYAELLEEGFLARPEFEDPHTGITWTPVFNSKTRMLVRSSLVELGARRLRNKFIAGYFKPKEHGKTLIFACGVAHAELLRKEFVRRHPSTRVAAIYAHHANDKMTPSQRSIHNRRVLEDFRCGRIQVLIGIEMITHGLDVPDIATIFVARPTESERLYYQMVGRGARITKKKKTFLVVDFTDNITIHADIFNRAKRSFRGALQRSRRGA